MNQPEHEFSELFEQLGLPSDEAGIREFMSRNSPLAREIELAAAPFWTPAQAAFLKEETLKDADWVDVIDQLNLGLRAPRP